ncbi:MAG: DUF4124 domain-containing protein [Marinagarivorans sp.]|nr:DUF4124 domain-containing protein [Marinagarivorans sp.]
MRWVLRKVIVVLCLAFGFVNYWVYLNGGKPPFLIVRDAVAGFWWHNLKPSLASWRMPNLSVPDIGMPEITLPRLTAPDFNVDGSASGAQNSNLIEVYKWVDAQGVINYAQKKPEGVNVDVLVVYRDTNILQSQAVASPKSQPQHKTHQTKIKEEGASLPPEKSLSPAQMENLFEDTYKVRAQMEAHNQALENIINNNLGGK